MYKSIAILSLSTMLLTACTSAPSLTQAPGSAVAGIDEAAYSAAEVVDLGAKNGGKLYFKVPESNAFQTQAVIGDIDHYYIVLKSVSGPGTYTANITPATPNKIASLIFNNVPFGAYTLQVLAMSGSANSNANNITQSVAYSGPSVSGAVNALTASLNLTGNAEVSACLKLIPTVVGQNDNGDLQVNIGARNGDEIPYIEGVTSSDSNPESGCPSCHQ